MSTTPADRGLHPFSLEGIRYFVVVRPVDGQSVESPALTAAKRAVLVLVAEGLSNREIAARRGTSPRTIANQVASLLAVFGASSREELALLGRGVVRRKHP